jgi:hypothetical protein
MFDKITDSVIDSERLYELLKKINGVSFKLDEKITHPSIALQVVYKIDKLKPARGLCKFLDREIKYWIDECNKSRIDLTRPRGEIAGFDVWLKTDLPRRGFIINLFNPPGNPRDNNIDHPHNPPPK